MKEEFETPSKKNKNALERFLSIFADVRPTEGRTVLMLAINLFLLFTAYYLIKPVREALILAEEGAEIKSYAAAGQALLLLGAVPLYAWIASGVARQRLINIVTAFFIACLPGFYLLAQTGVPVGVVFFLWVGVFNLMIPAQLWGFANDLYSPGEGKRLFAIVAFGATSGSVAGSFIAGRLIEPIGVYQLMLVSAAVLGLSLILTNVISRSERKRVAGNIQENASSGEEPIGKGGAFRLVLQSRYLLLIAFMILMMNWVNTTGEYMLGKVVEQSAEEAVAAGTAGALSVEDYIGKFYADFFSIVNLASVLIQLFLVSRFLKYLGVKISVLILPVLALTGYLVIAFYPILTAIRWSKTAENATDYSLQNTVRHALFLPTSRVEKYKAKQATDTFFWRVGDMLQAATVYTGTAWLSLSISEFALFNAVLALVWLSLGLFIGMEFHRKAEARSGLPEPTPAPA